MKRDSFEIIPGVASVVDGCLHIQVPPDEFQAAMAAATSEQRMAVSHLMTSDVLLGSLGGDVEPGARPEEVTEVLARLVAAHLVAAQVSPAAFFARADALYQQTENPFRLMSEVPS